MGIVVLFFVFLFILSLVSSSKIPSTVMHHQPHSKQIYLTQCTRLIYSALYKPALIDNSFETSLSVPILNLVCHTYHELHQFTSEELLPLLKPRYYLPRFPILYLFQVEKIHKKCLYSFPYISIETDGMISKFHPMKIGATFRENLFLDRYHWVPCCTQ